MYLKLMTVDEQEQVVRALKGPEWIRTNHGSLYDRGSADSYYHRLPGPHYGGVGGDSGPRVEVKDEDSVAEYMAGYNDNEQSGAKKDWQ